MKAIEIAAVFINFCVLFGLCLHAFSAAFVVLCVPAAIAATVVVYR